MTKLNPTAARNYCFGCGPHNTRGMHLKFQIEGADPVVRGNFRMPSRFQGSRNVLHGGIVALLLDEAMGKFNRMDRIIAPTAELSVQYLRPVPVGRKIVVEARQVRREGRNYWRECTIQDEDGKLLALGKGRFVKVGDAPASPANGRKQ
jgi:uncharacterized protein (TIGR00369 family)